MGLLSYVVPIYIAEITPKNLRGAFTTVHQEDNEEPEEKIEEDMSDRIARERAEEEARQQALLRKRSKVLQRELPRPPAPSVESLRKSLLRADEDKSKVVPPTPIEQANEMITKELLSLLEHDNAKYPLDEKVDKRKKKGTKRSTTGSTFAVPEIDDFEEDELKEADSIINEEVQYLRLAMGHEDKSLDEFVEAHKTCMNEFMFFPKRNAYGESSVAGSEEKIEALRNEFENVKKKLEDDLGKAASLEKKVKVRTHGYEPCSNADCMYLHDFGSQEDSFSKDELISAFERSKDLQIIGVTNNMHQRPGKGLLPPVDEYSKWATSPLST